MSRSKKSYSVKFSTPVIYSNGDVEDALEEAEIGFNTMEIQNLKDVNQLLNRELLLTDSIELDEEEHKQGGIS